MADWKSSRRELRRLEGATCGPPSSPPTSGRRCCQARSRRGGKQSAGRVRADLANIIGSAPDNLTSWQQAIIALAFELCLVGMMVGFTVLGEVATTPEPPGPAKPAEPEELLQQACRGATEADARRR